MKCRGPHKTADQSRICMEVGLSTCRRGIEEPELHGGTEELGLSASRCATEEVGPHGAVASRIGGDARRRRGRRRPRFAQAPRVRPPPSVPLVLPSLFLFSIDFAGIGWFCRSILRPHPRFPARPCSRLDFPLGPLISRAPLDFPRETPSMAPASSSGTPRRRLATPRRTPRA